MKLQSPTLILVLVAVALGGFVAALELFQGNDDEAVGDRQALFEFTEAEVERLTVTTPDQELQFSKSGEQWLMRSPSLAPADEATIVFLVNLMASAESDRVFEVERENLRDFGFSPPLATVEVELENDDTHRLLLGAYDFDRSNIYAQTDSTVMPESSQDSADSSTDTDVTDTDATDTDATDTDATDTDATDTDATDTDATDATGEDTPAPTEPVEVFIVSPSFETAINRPREDWLQREESDPDPESLDAESPDPESTDTESTDTESTDTESTDTESTDAESADAESTDTESADAESTDAESTEATDTEPVDPEETDTESPD